jgi:hypothetical protein
MSYYRPENKDDESWIYTTETRSKLKWAFPFRENYDQTKLEIPLKYTIFPSIISSYACIIKKIRLTAHFDLLISAEGGKRGENPSKQVREPTNSPTHMWCQVQESNLGHSSERRAGYVKNTVFETKV